MLAVFVTVASRRRSQATSIDYYLAGRSVGVVTNACAICGDYFSAASFLGVAAAVYTSGLDGVWYATGFAAGFVPVLLFVAAPLRRFGDYSIPDFLRNRFDSERVRVIAVVMVQLVILAYLVPQAVGSGVTWDLLVGRGVGGLSPYATGVVATTALVAVLVMVGGMRGTTWNQAVQFLFLLVTLLWLAALVIGHGFSYPDAVTEASARPLTVPVADADGPTTLEPVVDRLQPGREARFGAPGARYGPLGQFALVITLVLGTAGLPHVMNRFFTSPSGRAARMTTVWVLGLAGSFYAVAVMLGTAARVVIADEADDHAWLADLTVDGVLEVPEHALLALGRLFAGSGGLGMVAAGALLAIISTIGGLLLAAAASWGHDIYERHINPAATQRQLITAGQVAVVSAAVVSASIALAIDPQRLSGTVPSVVATMVTWAFALAGSAITPAFLLSIWWRRATATGVAAGMVTGGVVVLALIAGGLARGLEGDGVSALLLAPAMVAAPAAAAVTVIVSRRSPAADDLERIWLRLHGTAADRRAERLARLTAEGVLP